MYYKNSKYTVSTPCICEVQINKIIVAQNLQLIMLSTVHLKGTIEPDQVPATLINVSNDVIYLTKQALV